MCIAGSSRPMSKIRMSVLKNAYALLIGIDYEDGLDTRGDAEDLAAVLTDASLCGYPPENVTLLTGSAADRKGIMDALQALVEQTDEQSSVFLFYSGHGDVLDGTFHFVPYGMGEGMEYDAYTAAWVTADEIREKINQMATRRLIFFMDCCHATGIAAAGIRPKKVEAVARDSAGAEHFDRMEGLAQKVDNEKGISIVASCKEEQESYQLEGDKNSVFTKYLLKALRAEHQEHFKDPFVRILEVAGYLLRTVPDSIKKVAEASDPPLEIRQEPYVNLEMYDNFILSYVPESRRKASMQAPSPQAVVQPPRDKKPRLTFREEAGANNLILFIHGFTGESGDTFGNLPDLLMEDPEMDGWDMKPFGYSQFIEPEHGKHVWGGIKDIRRIVEYLCTSMRYKFAKYDRVAIVAHGLGGLVAQQAILNFEEAQRKKLTHLILIACPSQGIPEAELQASWQAEHQEIGANADFIRTLRRDWKNAFGDQYPFKLGVAAASDDQFVDIASCFGPFPKPSCHLLQANHFSIVKPEGQDSDSYQWVRTLLTQSEFFKDFGDARERNLALGKYDAVVRELLEDAAELDPQRLRQLIFALEGLDRREEAMKLLESHPVLQHSTDFMGIIGGRYKRAYLKKPQRRDGEAAQVYYGLALEEAESGGNPGQIYYHSINLAFLALVVEEDRKAMLQYAKKALEATEKAEDSLWKTATRAEANLYLGNLEEARKDYARAAEAAGVRQKISMHLNASAAYSRLSGTETGKDDFLMFLDSVFLS